MSCSWNMTVLGGTTPSCSLRWNARNVAISSGYELRSGMAPSLQCRRLKCLVNVGSSISDAAATSGGGS